MGFGIGALIRGGERKLRGRDRGLGDCRPVLVDEPDLAIVPD
jgi:hypothetical protein